MSSELNRQTAVCRTAIVWSCLVVSIPSVNDLSSFADEPPAERIDLSSWKLTLPEDTDLPGKPDEIVQPRLATFVHPKFFHPYPAGGLVFRAPCGGATTKGSGYPRSELREMNPATNDEAGWNTDDGRVHTLTARLVGTVLPQKKPHVVCAQIHDDDDDVLKIRVEGRRLLIERDGEDDIVIDRSYSLGTPFDLVIAASGGTITVTHNRSSVMTWKTARKKCYFKIGCYTQSNVSKGDSAESTGEVIVTKLAISHSPGDLTTHSKRRGP